MPKTLKAENTRDRIVAAAAAVLRAEGPRAVTHRNVARWAKVSPSAPNYYFDSIEELLHEAGARNIRMWAKRAEGAAARAEQLPSAERQQQSVELLLDACLPHDGTKLQNHYAQLLAVAQAPAVADAYRLGRQRLDAAVGRILTCCGWDLDARTVIALVDGAAVAALSEGRPVEETVKSLLEAAFARHSHPPSNTA